MGGADGGRARFEGCGKGPVIANQACGAVDDVLPDRECWVKRVYFFEPVLLGCPSAKHLNHEFFE